MLDAKADAARAAAGPREVGAGFAVGQQLPIDSIRTDGGTQARAGLNEDAVKEYADAWLQLSREQDGFLKMPLIVVFHDGENYWLADGFHRVEAARRIGRTALRADVQMGDLRTAILFAVGANDKHGLRRTPADKRRAAATLLRDAEWTQWSDSAIAKQVNVDHKTVAAVRAELVATGEIPGSAIRQSADGKVRDVSGISESNAKRTRQLPPVSPPVRPNAPAGWVWRDDGSLRCLADGVIVRPRMTDAGTVAEAEQRGRISANLAAQEQPKIPEVATPADPRAALEARGWSFVPAETPRGWFRLDHPEIGYVRQEPTIEEAIKAATGLQANYDRRARLAQEEIERSKANRTARGDPAYAEPNTPAAAPTIESLDASLEQSPLHASGYFWQSANPPILANNDGWRGDAPTVDGALALANDREKQRAQMKLAISQAQHMIALLYAGDWNGATRTYTALGRTMGIEE